ncbi:MAG: amino acid carrier protein [Pseudomonadota bacterium]
MFDACFPKAPDALKAFAESCTLPGLDNAIDCTFAKISCISNGTIFYSIPVELENAGTPETFDIPILLAWLAACSIFFTLYLGFINIRYFGHAFAVTFKKKYAEPDAKGELTNFQSLAASLSGTVGLGNIAGVAVAVSLGGPGAVFWMMVMGFLGMSTKFAEVTIGTKYRRDRTADDSPHTICGGPMYYVRDAFENRNIPYIGSILAVIFALSCIAGSLGGGNMFQANQSYEQIVRITGGDASFFADKGWLFGILLAFLVGLVIVGGIKSIGRVASKLVPLMAIVYITAALSVIAMHWQNIPEAISTIFSEALNFEAGFGGILGGMLVGIQRASFSNEAGLGSAPIVQCTAKTNHPVRQGFVGMIGPFADTIVVCFITAMLIVVTGAYQGADGISGVELTSKAMEFGGDWLSYVLGIAVFLFAYSTLITWYYYGEIGLTYILGEKMWVAKLYKAIFLAVVVAGCSAKLGNFIDFTDGLFLSMGFANIIALYMFAPEIKRELKAYIKEMKNA